MATEYGVFNAERCVYDSMWSLQEAEAVAAEERQSDEDARAAAFCQPHRYAEQPADDCEVCATQQAEQAENGDGADDGLRYQIHAFGPRNYRVYDRDDDRDVANVTRKTQARAIAGGLNTGELLVDEQGHIVQASRS